MLARFTGFHDIIAMFADVILNAIVSMMLSGKPLRKEVAFVSWAFTVFLGVMWVIAVVMYFI